MRMSEAGLIALIGHEGIVLSTYLDSVGVPTIGVGHTKAAGGLDPDKFTGTLTMRQALDLLAADIVKYEDGVSKAVKVPLQQHEFDALVSFHFNTGAIGKATFVKLLNSGKRAEAMERFMDWNKPEEIIPRRRAERDLFLTGEYPKPIATIYPTNSKRKVLWSKGTRVNVRDLLGRPPLVIPPEPLPVEPPKPAPIPAPARKNWFVEILEILANAFKKG